jgi:hypothetical protein
MSSVGAETNFWYPSDDGPPFSIAAGIAELFPGGDPTAALEEADRRMFAEKRGR